MRAARTALPLLALVAACQAPGVDVSTLAALPPLDAAVMVTGGAFLTDGNSGAADAAKAIMTFAAGAGAEAIPLANLQAVLRDGAVFRRFSVDADPLHRWQVLGLLRPEGASDDPALRAYLQQTRDQGYDWLLVVEQLQNGAIEGQGINGRWPLTLSFWLLVGLGCLIPDHTFESRATLHVTLRDLQTGRVVHDLLLNAGPVDLSLVERGSLLSLVVMLIVPPFWISNVDDSVRSSVREFTERRLLVSLARELKGPAVRQHLRERSVAVLDVVRRDGRPWLLVDARESICLLQVRQHEETLLGPQADALQAALLASLTREDSGRLRYEAPLELPLQPGTFQVLLGTIAGNVVSATFSVLP